ncbi:hypothetical protein QM467_08755 [Rhodoblastus sp. 17X3]|uniref:hypothetical protein n=1 Tax=Rhodoblastus sp. 17X3 TaxID=3047026 RepID=UPI0024B7FADB|nr:hypothetical protein [Rhodoblastus sp. 17X3]MDI9848138.1 hypothetical protein [Rhodoblastus sp. 17X3]
MTHALEAKDRVAVTGLIAGDGIMAAARLIGINGLLAEGAMQRGDCAEAFSKLRLVADALEEAREIVRLVERIVK